MALSEIIGQRLFKKARSVSFGLVLLMSCSAGRGAESGRVLRINNWRDTAKGVFLS